MASGGSKTQTTKSEPWAPAQPYMQQALQGAGDVYTAGPPKYYQGNQVAGYMPQQAEAYGSIKQNAQNLSQYASGPNPYLGDMYDIGARNISDDVNSQFSKAGRYGSGAQTNVLSRNLGDMWTGLANDDMNRRLSAMGMAGQANGQWLDAANQIQDQRQSEIDANIKKWNYNQNAPRQNVEWLANIASNMGGAGGQETGQNPNYRSATDNLVGLGSSLGSAWLMSDRRLKADIVPLAAGWYSFRYVWEDPGTEHFGVMADEAPAHAVAHDEHHFSVVGYHLL